LGGHGKFAKITISAKNINLHFSRGPVSSRFSRDPHSFSPGSSIFIWRKNGSPNRELLPNITMYLILNFLLFALYLSYVIVSFIHTLCRFYPVLFRFILFFACFCFWVWIRWKVCVFFAESFFFCSLFACPVTFECVLFFGERPIYFGWSVTFINGRLYTYTFFFIDNFSWSLFRDRLTFLHFSPDHQYVVVNFCCLGDSFWVCSVWKPGAFSFYPTCFCFWVCIRLKVRVFFALSFFFCSLCACPVTCKYVSLFLANAQYLFRMKFDGLLKNSHVNQQKTSVYILNLYVFADFFSNFNLFGFARSKSRVNDFCIRCATV